MDIYTFCWIGFTIILAVLLIGTLAGIAACMLSSYISQELGEE